MPTSAGDKDNKSASKERCKVCGKLVDKSYIQKHMKKAHNSSQGQLERTSDLISHGTVGIQSKALGEGRERPAVAGSRNEAGDVQKEQVVSTDAKAQTPKMYITLQQLRAALDEENQRQLREGTQRSILESSLNQAEMIQQGLAFLENWNIRLEEPTRTVPTDGDCLLSALALAMNPHLGVLGLHKHSTQLRRDSVSHAMRVIENLSEERLLRLQKVAAPPAGPDDDVVLPTRQELIEMLSNYLRSGEYLGEMGDLMPIIAAYHLQTPILVVDLSVPGRYRGVFITPDEVFEGETRGQDIFVVARQGQHYESLFVPNSARGVLQEAYLTTQGCKPPGNMSRETRDKSPDPQGGGPSGGRQFNSSTGRANRQSDGGAREASPTRKNSAPCGSDGHFTPPGINSIPCSDKKSHRRSNSAPSIPSPQRQVLQRPDSSFGDRKRLQDMIFRMPTPFAARINELLDKLDDLWINSPTIIADMEQTEKEMDVILECVKRLAKNEKGGEYRTSLSERFGLGREANTLQVWLYFIRKKILPFLRLHCFPDRPDFRVTDLIAFGTQRFARISENMVVECNQLVGHSPDMKKCVLVSWKALFRAFILEAKNHVDRIGDDALRNIREWYEDVGKNVGHGITHMGAVVHRARTARKEKKEQREFVPVDQALNKWINSPERAAQIKNLENLAHRLRNGDSNVEIPAGTYLTLSEFMITELSAYSVVRIGAWVRMTMRQFVQSKPSWSTDGPNDTRSVTTLPPEACQHQSAGTTTAAVVGLNEDGEPCCRNAVPPTCFIARNDQDKGGKADCWMVISLEGHRFMLDFLLIREHYFRQNVPEMVDRIHGGSPVFLNSKGKGPEGTSNFRLNLLNRAVYGERTEIILTPQSLRSWNTTYLNEHEDEVVRSMRGPATGNTQVVFDVYYNVNRRAGIQRAMEASINFHQSGEATRVSFSQESEDRRRKDQNELDKENDALLSVPDGVDITSRRRPVPTYLKRQFREELERVSPGLWERAGSRAVAGTTEMAWIKEVLIILGRMDADSLRDTIYQQYRGDENPAKRQWSGLRSHVLAAASEKEKGGEVVR